jgi:hypothetical protein
MIKSGDYGSIGHAVFPHFLVAFSVSLLTLLSGCRNSLIRQCLADSSCYPLCNYPRCTDHDHMSVRFQPSFPWPLFLIFRHNRRMLLHSFLMFLVHASTTFEWPISTRQSTPSFVIRFRCQSISFLVCDCPLFPRATSLLILVFAFSSFVHWLCA